MDQPAADIFRYGSGRGETSGRRTSARHPSKSGHAMKNHRKPERRRFISTLTEMGETRRICLSVPDSHGKTRAMMHFQTARAAFDAPDETGCLEACRAAVVSLK
ncbi:MAG: hypothetical protein R6V26_05515 [Roseovarius sp.]